MRTQNHHRVLPIRTTILSSAVVELFLVPDKFVPRSVVDTFVRPNEDGWKHTGGYGYRKDNTGPDGPKFVQENWQLSGKNAMKGGKTNGGVKSYGVAFPVGTYCRKPLFQFQAHSL